MPLGSYTCNKKFTDAQKEDDADHGVYQVENRSF